jgi:lysylphosphatidylglycerol synthetase-like protein (DUF2156 family)
MTASRAGRVAPGDPVGADERMPALIQMFLERCDDFGGAGLLRGRERAPARYADVGLTFVKLGEEGPDRSWSFTLEARRAALSSGASPFRKEHAVFRMASPTRPASSTAAIGVDEWFRRPAPRRDSRSVF